MSKSREEAPAPVDAGLDGNDIVSMMLSAWHSEVSHRKRMTAALRVAADALLGSVTDEEAKDWSRDDWGVRYLYQNGVDELLAARRARLLAPAKSVEDLRVLRVAQIVSRFEGITDSVALAEEIIATLKQEPRP